MPLVNETRLRTITEAIATHSGWDSISAVCMMLSRKVADDMAAESCGPEGKLPFDDSWASSIQSTPPAIAGATEDYPERSRDCVTSSEAVNYGRTVLPFVHRRGNPGFEITDASGMVTTTGTSF